MNINKMMKQAQEMQQKMAEIQDKMEELEVEGVSGGGMVKVTINGKGEAKKVVIDPEIVDPADVEMMEDLVVAAFNDAKVKTEAALAEEMSDVTGGMQLPPGMKLPF